MRGEGLGLPLGSGFRRGEGRAITVWMSREYISICRRPITWTEPARQIRLLSLRSTSVHIVSSDSSFLSDRICLIRSASSSASRPRRIVPEIGHVSQRHPLALRSTRTNISGARADEVLGGAEVEEEAVRRRVALAEAAEHLGRRRRARLVEGLREHRLEEVAHLGDGGCSGVRELRRIAPNNCAELRAELVVLHGTPRSTARSPPSAQNRRPRGRAAAAGRPPPSARTAAARPSAAARRSTRRLAVKSYLSRHDAFARMSITPGSRRAGTAAGRAGWRRAAA